MSAPSISFPVYAPGFMFQDIGGAPIEIKNKQASVAASTNAELIAAVTGKRIRVLEIIINQTSGSAAQVAFRDGAAAGTILLLTKTDSAAVGTQWIHDLHELGHLDTSAGNALWVGTGSGGNVNISVRYIEYTQPAI